MTNSEMRRVGAVVIVGAVALAFGVWGMGQQWSDDPAVVSGAELDALREKVAACDAGAAMSRGDDLTCDTDRMILQQSEAGGS